VDVKLRHGRSFNSYNSCIRFKTRLRGHGERRLFVTFDQRTIPDLLRFLAAEQRPHSGVIFGGENTVKPSHPGAVAGALGRLAMEIGNSDTRNPGAFYAPGGRPRSLI
jgi:hypothetical protein